MLQSSVDMANFEQIKLFLKVFAVKYEQVILSWESRCQLSIATLEILANGFLKKSVNYINIYIEMKKRKMNNFDFQ